MGLDGLHPYLQLLDWRRRVHALYADVRALLPADPAAAHARWRQVRDELVGGHPQSPLEEADRAAFRGLRSYPYDPRLVFTAAVEPLPAEERLEVGASRGEALAFHRFGLVELPIGRLEVYWLDAYGGGLFLPFRDATAGRTTYGGGRYLLDTVKGADLGSTPDGRLVLDFNFAYHPSCHYSPLWACPLSPRANWLDVPVEAGEQAYPGP